MTSMFAGCKTQIVYTLPAAPVGFTWESWTGGDARGRFAVRHRSRV